MMSKRVFPLLWFGFLAFLAAAMIAEGAPRVELLLIPLVTAIVSYLLMRRLVFDLVDEVWDAGDALIVKNGNQEDRVPLSEIVNISQSFFSSPPRVTLTLNTPSRFGEKVTFSPSTGFFPLAKKSIVTELAERVKAIQSRSADRR